MTILRRRWVVLMVIWISACGGGNTPVTSPSASKQSSTSSTTSGGQVLPRVHALAGASITFHVQDGTGAPIAGALLQATSPTVGSWQGATDGVGNFNADLAPAHYDLVISAAGFGTRTMPADLASAGVVTIGLTRGGPTGPTGPTGQISLTGKVTDGTSGGILPNILLTLSGGASATTTTDGNGNYQFANLAAGSYTVSASPTSYVPNSQFISLTSGTTVLNLVLQRGTSAPQALSATFVVQSTATAPKADTCDVTAGQKVKCIFDASGSSPASSLTNYRFLISETNESFSSANPKLTEPTLPSCGLFGIIKDSNGVFPVTMTVTVTSSDGRTAVSQRKTVSFQKNGAC